MRCPGQDRRFWTEDAVFDVPCPKCGAQVEFFKDESSGRCPRCGHRLTNPSVASGCAEWCAFAEQCVGTIPASRSSTPPREGAFISRLIREVKEQFEHDQAGLTRALVVFQHAKELVSKESGNPLVILAATLIRQVEKIERKKGKELPTGHPSTIEQTLRRVGLDDDTIGRVSQVVAAGGIDISTTQGGHLDSAERADSMDPLNQGRYLDQAECDVVADAQTLADLAAGKVAADREAFAEWIELNLRTITGKERARALFQP